MQYSACAGQRFSRKQSRSLYRSGHCTHSFPLPVDEYEAYQGPDGDGLAGLAPWARPLRRTRSTIATAPDAWRRKVKRVASLQPHDAARLAGLGRGLGRPGRSPQRTQRGVAGHAPAGPALAWTPGDDAERKGLHPGVDVPPDPPVCRRYRTAAPRLAVSLFTFLIRNFKISKMFYFYIFAKVTHELLCEFLKTFRESTVHPPEPFPSALTCFPEVEGEESPSEESSKSPLPGPLSRKNTILEFSTILTQPRN